ncbi:family A G protein-coupled receptor-like protein [Trametopsis cervina]|nr:family A G protein-coupled receptor-like protein [Trametopsis cervina]
MAGSSLDQNPPNADRHLTAGGSDWLWAVFAIMALSTLGMVAYTWTRPRGTRLFHNLATIILATSAVTYFSMASDLGATPVRAEFSRGTTFNRQIFYVRYIQWFINFPLLLTMLLYTSGLALSDILTTAFFAWVVVVTGLVGALTSSTYKWGYFTMGVFALFYIWHMLMIHARRSTFHAGDGMRSGFTRGAGFVTFLTMLYPIAWGLSEGGNVISPTREMIFYGILDLILGPLFLFYFVWGLRNVEYATFGLRSCKYTDVVGNVVPVTTTTGPGVAVVETARARRSSTISRARRGSVASISGYAPGVPAIGDAAVPRARRASGASSLTGYAPGVPVVGEMAAVRPTVVPVEEMSESALVD